MSVAFVVVFIFPLRDPIVALQASIVEKEEIISELKHLITKIDQWHNQINDREADIEKLNLALPSEKAIPDFIVSLRSLAGSSGMILNDIKIVEFLLLFRLFWRVSLLLSYCFPSFRKFSCFGHQEFLI